MKTKINLEKMKGWNFYGDASLLEYAPKKKGKLEFFTLEKYVSDSELAKEYESRGLMPANPELIAEYVLASPDFEEKYIGTHWYDADGAWCYAAFNRMEREHENKQTWDEIFTEKLERMIEGNDRLASLVGNHVLLPTNT